MSKKWHKGPPPSVGWWPASVERDPNWLRWWNGRFWSTTAGRGCSEDQVKDAASTRAFFAQSRIEWTDRPKDWPARSYT